MTLAEGSISIDTIDTIKEFQINERQTESGSVNGIRVAHTPGVGGGVTAYQEQIVSDPTRPYGFRWDLIPIEGATDIPPGTSADFIIKIKDRDSVTRVSINHHPKPKEIEVERKKPRQTEGSA